MDWQTKEYIDSRFDDLEEKIDLIIQHLNINQDSEEDYSDEVENDSEEINL